jgi:methylase of polypeptide subunit release factors
VGKIIEIKDLGEAYLPTVWEEALQEGESPKRFSADPKNPPNALLKHLRLGGAALLSGSWADVTRLLAAVEKRKQELLGYSGERKVEREKGKKYWEEVYEQLLARLLLTASPEGVLDTDLPLNVPHLLEFMGDYSRQSQGGDGRRLPLLVPVVGIQKVLASLDTLYPVVGLDEPLLAPESVLQPRQQEVYELLREALVDLHPKLPAQPTALDMGCGSGALSLLLARGLAERGAEIWASDILPEALATTRLNVERFVGLGQITNGVIHVSEGGDLYAPLGEQRFDLITFNPPWANAPARTRLEGARYDFGQRTIRRFLEETPAHLKEQGHLLLFYSDNAGDEAVETLQGHIARAGLRVVKTTYRRIRITRKWENIYLYDLALTNPAILPTF